jgi:hypothetical protein
MKIVGCGPRQLSHGIMNSGNVLRQNTSNSVRAAHAISDQAHVRRADTQVVGYARVKPEVQFVNSKEMFFVQLAFRFFGIDPHAPPPRGRCPKQRFPT